MDRSCNQEFGEIEFLSEADKRRIGHPDRICAEGIAALCGAAEAEATAVKRGLWADNEPVPPWDYRSAKPKN